MSYIFMPRGIQKRLLRFLLTQLDFIETEDLELDNLGLTWGQRSVIELKNIGLKTKKLASLVSQPETLDISSARISLLTITVPADILTSSIEIEILGVNVYLRLGQPKPKAQSTSTRQHERFSKSTKSDGFQTGVPSIHDPGGLSESKYGPLEETLLHPELTAHHLAQSFLQTETRQDRLELQAAIASRSSAVEESLSSSLTSEDEVGLGVDDGYALPSFIASYLVGIGNRLQIQVRNVSIHIEVERHIDDAAANSVHPVRFLVTLAKARVANVVTGEDVERSGQGRRKITVERFGVFIIPDSSQTTPCPSSPSTASPRLKHSRLVGSPTLARSPDARSALSSQSSSQDQNLGSGFSNPSFGTASVILEGLSFHDHLEPGETPPLHGSPPLRSTTADSEIDNRVRAQAALTSGHSFERSLGFQTPPSVQDLTESRIFTHDEAESMYMSAMSTDPMAAGEPSKRMPGTWGESEEVWQPKKPLKRSSTHSSQPNPDVEEPSRNPLQGISQQTDVPRQQAVPVNPQAVTPGHDLVQATYSTGQLILLIDRASATLPSDHQCDPGAGRAKVNIDGSSDPRASLAYGEYDGEPIKDNSLSNSGIPSIDIGVRSIHFQFDLDISKLLIGLAASYLKSDQQTQSTKAGLEMKSTSLNLSLWADMIEIDCLSQVPEIEIMTPSIKAPSEDLLLLSISLEKLNYRSIASDKANRQSIKVGKLLGSHSRGPFFYFGKDTKMGVSMKDSVLLEKNDIDISAVTSAGETKLEIQTKTLAAVVNLVHFDEILSRSGGLSNLLELGNSMTSTGTVRSSPRKKSVSRAEPRGVRFNTPSDPGTGPAGELGFGLGKLNIRFAGVSLDLLGSESTLRATTSAVKVVHRTEGLGVQIDSITLEGPFPNDRHVAPALSIDLHNLRSEYRPVPGDQDLDRLLSILTPSNDTYDNDDDIMVDTLLRQRRKGAVLRLTMSFLSASLDGLNEIDNLNRVVDELGRLSSVAKYLPEDDRPGILVLGHVKSVKAEAKLDEPVGQLELQANDVEAANVSVPSLSAARIRSIGVKWKQTVTLVTESVQYPRNGAVPPMVMCRFVADEMEPTVKVKLFNFRIEYHVEFLAALQSAAELQSADKTDNGSEKSSQSLARESSQSSTDSAAEFVRRTNISLAIRESSLGLNPRNAAGKALFLLTDAIVSSPLKDQKRINISGELKKGSILAIDQATAQPAGEIQPTTGRKEDQMAKLVRQGYMTLGYVSSAKVTVTVGPPSNSGPRPMEVELGNALLILESCADSTQTLINVLNGLNPPPAPKKKSPYRTEIMPIEDLLASFTGDAFVTQPGPEAGLRASSSIDSDSDETEQPDMEYISEFYPSDPDEADSLSDTGFNSEILDSEMAESIVSISVAPVSINPSAARASSYEGMSNSLLDFREEHFGQKTDVGGTAHRWDSTQNTYEVASQRSIQRLPLKARVRNIHIIWNLFDGYDWQSTREVISEAVKELEVKAGARRPRSNSRVSPSADQGEESVIGDFLFNSIYIGIPANRDPNDLIYNINRDIDDIATETGSIVPSTVTGSPARHHIARPRQNRLRLKRSKQHKMTFELKGIFADILVFAPGSGEVESSVDVRVKDLEIFDHVPTSTWKKFATYMRDAGEREADTSMIHLELLNVRPVPDLAASEMIMKVTVLPLRLHVDQDALDFLTRFFEFKDENAMESSTPSSPPFLQRVEVNPVRVKLDFKPKRVDYGGLRSGKTTEFMNFFVLDQAEMVLRRVIVYGVSGFDRLGIMLNNIWMPDIKRNQLPGILAGIAPIRSLVNVGSGVKDLVVVPMREYQKDGRIVRSIQKGALAFAKTTSKELIGLGAKLAIGTQTVLETAESLLAPANPEASYRNLGEDDDSADSEKRRQISLYADQPIGVVQGLRGAYAGLERDLLLAKDAIIAVPGEAMASGSAAGAAKAVMKQAPTIILRPAIGATKAVGQTLLGAGNTLDRESYRRAEEKYKKH